MKTISKKEFLMIVYSTYYEKDLSYLKNLQSALSLLVYFKENDSQVELLKYINNQKGVIVL